MKKKVTVVLILSFILSLMLVFVTRHPMLPDSYGYNAIGVNIASGNGYKDNIGEVTMAREPMYPLFLAVMYKIFGYRYFPVQIVQVGLFLLTVILVYRIAKLTFDRQIALYSMVITALFPTLINYPSYILSETLFTFLTSLLVFSCIKIYFTDKWIYYILTGLVLGASVLCKAIMLPFIFVVICWRLLLGDKRRCNIKNMIIKISVMVLIFITLVVPWMYRNYVNFGSFSLRGGSEEPLCAKVIKLNYGFEDFKKAFIFTISENLGKRMFPDAIENPRDFLFKEDILVREKMLPELREKGYTSKEIKNMMMNEIMKRPIKFIAISSLDLFKMTQFTYLPILIDQEYLIEKITNVRHGVFLLSLSRGIFRFLAYLLILFSIIAMWMRKAEWRNLIFLVILVCYTNLIYSLIYGHGRYGVPLIPYYIILSAPAIVMIKEKMKGIIKCQK